MFFSSDQQQQKQRNQSSFRWNLAKLDKSKFERIVRGGEEEIETLPAESAEETEKMVDAAMALIEKACHASMPKKISRQNKPAIYWWNSDIANLRTECQRLRRRTQRARRGTDQEEVYQRKEEEREAKKRLNQAIKNSKNMHWKALCTEVDNDPWGLGYKIVMKKLGKFAKPPPRKAEVMENIVTTLFPEHEVRPEQHIEETGEIPPFTEAELKTAMNSMKNKKAPGPDGIPSEVLKLVIETSPKLLLNVYNACLKNGIFPKRWKKQKLVLISKSKGDPNTAAGNRPLCMLDTAGKLLEKLIRPRLQIAVQKEGGLSNKQYGFRKGRSTCDAVALVRDAFNTEQKRNHHSRRGVMLGTIDIKNAFNSASWKGIIRILKCRYKIPLYLLRILEEYLKDRQLLYETEDGFRTRKVTAGVAQGSILGPELWNIFYDGILRIELPDDCSLVGYADDIAILIKGRSHEEIQDKLTLVMRRLKRWLDDHGLELAAEKTELVLLTRKHKATLNNIHEMQVENQQIRTKDKIKYLGFTLDSKMNFGEHIREVAKKASTTVVSLSRLMRNTGGPRASKRKLLMSVTNSIILYGAEIWGDVLQTGRHRAMIARVQRRSALRISSAYRTVSEPAVLAIAGAIPIDLLALEKKVVFDKRNEAEKKGQAFDHRKIAKQERETTLERWQDRRKEDQRGKWTRRLLPCIKTWLKREHGDVNYYLTQLLSGHGYFRSYLYRLGKVANDNCLACGQAPDDVEHTFFKCPQWTTIRQELTQKIGQFNPENIVELMLKTVENWKLISHYVETVLRNKKSRNFINDDNTN